jgi:hypothetical protein
MAALNRKLAARPAATVVFKNVFIGFPPER